MDLDELFVFVVLALPLVAVFALAGWIAERFFDK